MTSSPKTIPFERYLAIDAHKRYVMVGGLNAQQEPICWLGRSMWMIIRNGHRPT